MVRDFPNIPANGVRFRLKARDSEHVLFSRDSPNPTVGHYYGPPYDDQIFILIYGTGDRRGKYAIKSWYCGKVLFSRFSREPHVGNIAGDGQYPDNWFQFIQDDNDKDSFRIFCPASESVLYSRSRDPTFGNYQGPKYNDQLWRFVRV